MTDLPPLITVEELREFCRIDADLDAAAEAELETLRDAAIETGEHLTGRKWREKWTPETFPRSLKLWVLNRVATANDRRTDVQTSSRETIIAMPREHSERLLDPWRIYGRHG